MGNPEKVFTEDIQASSRAYDTCMTLCMKFGGLVIVRSFEGVIAVPHVEDHLVFAHLQATSPMPVQTAEEKGTKFLPRTVF